MDIQIKSDLHWEHDVHQTRPRASSEEDSAYVSPKAEVLILAGDMINAKEAHIDYLLHKFEDIKIPILYVPGNHEYWTTSYQVGNKLLREKLAGTNITLLDADYCILKDRDDCEVVFVGATLWTSLVNPMKAMVAQQTRDFANIKGMTVDAWTNRHDTELMVINEVLTYSDFEHMKKVVISHYLPSYESVPERFKGDMANCIFVAENSEVIIDECQPDLWVHGHTHDSNDYFRGKTRILSNPKGRWYQDFNGLNPNYNNELIINI